MDIEAKRKEIREEMAGLLSLNMLGNYLANLPHDEAEYVRFVAGECLNYLHSQGVVIKTTSEWCPQHGYPIPCHKCGAKQGQALIAPLIKEG